jgi:hypothetical protein
MDRWKNKEAFLQWVELEKQKAKDELKYIKNENNGIVDNDEKTMRHIMRLIWTLEISTDDIKRRITKNEFEYLTQTSLTINLLCITAFINTVEDIEYFKKSKLSTDGKEYNREVNQLKNKADTLQFYSSKSIEIKIPKLPHVSIYEMVYVLKSYGADEASIKLLNSYFDDRIRLPKKSTSVIAEEEKIKHTADLMSESLKVGIYQRDPVMMNTILVEAMDYYIPDINLSYDRKLSQKKT